MENKLLKNIAIYVVSAVGSILLICYVLYHLLNGFETKLETTPAIIATQEQTISLDAYIFRDETVLTATQSGGVNYLFENGERVSVGNAVANIYSGAGLEELSDRILDINNKVNVLEASSAIDKAMMSDTKSLDTKINELYYIIRDKLEDGDIEYALYKKDELLTLLNKRQIITQSVSGYDDKILSLKNEREMLSAQLNNVTEKIVAPASGYFYNGVDGYENIFTVKSLQDMTLESYTQLVNSDPYPSPLAVCKIVNSYRWYIASEITKDGLKNFAEGNSYSVKFPYNADTIIPMMLDRIIQTNDSDRVVLLFRTDMMPDGFNYLRKQSVEIVRESVTGYKVPSSSVRIVDGVRGVYILNGNTIAFKQIEVLSENDGFYIVKEQPSYFDDKEYYKKLGLYEMIVTNGRNLFDGKIVNNAG